MLPRVAAEECFALKGGTAINLFVRDMPRLSVDLDLVYVPVNERATALREIGAALTRIKAAVKRALRDVRVVEGGAEAGSATTLYVSRGRAEIKIEVNFVLRGTVYPGEVRDLAPQAEQAFGSATIGCVSFQDLYAGKLVAALDRQHPRDLFDAKILLESEGIDDRLFGAFVVYLVSHNRTFAELLDPPRKDIGDIYEKSFKGLALQPVALRDLLDAREALIRAIHARIGDKERALLLSVKRLEPDWSLLAVRHAPELPGIRWKLRNLERMDAGKRRAAIDNLERVLDRIAGKP
ncbi:MAG: nucleotidyl transferase AbiEii/AbiGii toxin family protein [Burkholderiales bacterium]